MSDTGAKSRESKTDVGNATGRGKALARPAAPEVWTQPKEPQSISRTVRESRLEDSLREHETTDENWTSGTSEASPALGPRTVVEQGTEFKGVFVSDCAIEVKGRVRGGRGRAVAHDSRLGRRRGEREGGRALLGRSDRRRDSMRTSRGCTAS